MSDTEQLTLPPTTPVSIPTTSPQTATTPTANPPFINTAPPIYPYQPRPKKTYPIDPADTVLALALLVVGYLAWDWVWPKDLQSSMPHFPGISFTLYVCLALVCSMVYFRGRKLRLTKLTILEAAIIVLTVLPFTLYDTTPVHMIAMPVLAVGYITWHAYAARTAISDKPGALTAADVLNQTVVVPMSNLGSWFSAVKGLPRGKKALGQILFAIIGVAVALPVIGIVLALLTQSDQNFDSWMSQLIKYATEFSPWGFIWKLLLGIPVAIYLFALMYGDAHRMGTESITHERATRWSRSAQRITTIALAAPTAILCCIYIVFFAAMGSYLFSAFTGRLPAQSTYAEFAREGFFQLATVAGINLAVLGFTYLFAKRIPSHSDSHPELKTPPSLRILGTVLSGLTLLLVITAMSKMILYVDQYGLTRLRVYTLWFMGVLFVIFALVGLWHVRRFRVDIPIFWVVALSFIGLIWADTDAVISQYNVDNYLKGTINQVDIAYLADDLSDAVVPSLVELAQEAPTSNVRLQALSAIQSHLTRENSAEWTSWNWQSFYAENLLK